MALYYNGKKVIDYCKEHNLSYDEIMKKYSELKKEKKFERYSNKELFEYLVKETKIIYRKTKYTYKDIPLKDYCKINNLNYNSIFVRLKRLKKTDIYKDFNDNDLLELIINSNKTIIRTNTKYLYKNISLKKYCKKNNICYNAIITKFKKLKKDEQNKNLTDEELFDIIINEYLKNKKANISRATKYFYKGASLRHYCENNNLNYTYITIKYKRLRKESKYDNLSDENLLDLIINKDKINRIVKYHYNGESFYHYCQKNNLNYQHLSELFTSLRKKEEYKNLKDEKLFELIINQVKNHAHSKYFYKKMKLIDYCQNKKFSYEKIVESLERLKLTESAKTKNNDELIELAIKKSGESLRIPLKERLNDLKTCNYLKNLDENELFEIADNKYKYLIYSNKAYYDLVIKKRIIIDYLITIANLLEEEPKYRRLTDNAILKLSINYYIKKILAPNKSKN